ncbi:MAG: hypothetical protein KGL42_04105 [Betaproteobacteria bacterium]|nr:hypothetical protein [Betaproteobacteria bacterium]
MRPWSKTELGAKPLEVTPVQATLSLDGSKAVQTGWTMCPIATVPRVDRRGRSDLLHMVDHHLPEA